MCGIVGVVTHAPASQTLYDALLLLQHRGQQAAGIATDNDSVFALYKANGLVTDVFRTRNMRALRGKAGIGHCSCAAYGPSCAEEAQPFYVNAPYGITLAHNGQVSNGDALRAELSQTGRRHLNTLSDAEVLLNVLAHELYSATKGADFTLAALFTAVAGLQRRVQGSYAAVAQVAGHGLLAFRDPQGIRPLCMGVRHADQQGDNPGAPEYMLASESVALEGMGYRYLRDVAPCEAVFVSLDGSLLTRQLSAPAPARPSAFEFVSLARPDSVIDGASVYASRLKLGELLAQKVRTQIDPATIDVVMPFDDVSRPAAIQLALKLGIKYREGYIHSRYPGRMFDLPDQVERRVVNSDINTIGSEFRGKRILLVEDAIVDAASTREIVQLARAAGATYVALASTAPPVLHPKVYGVDWPARRKPAAMGATHEAMRENVTADALVFQDIDALQAAITSANPSLRALEISCFDHAAA